MTADSALLLIVGLAAGFWLGVLTTWTRAKKLEHFGVSLTAWESADLEAQSPAAPLHRRPLW